MPVDPLWHSLPSASEGMPPRETQYSEMVAAPSETKRAMHDLAERLADACGQLVDGECKKAAGSLLKRCGGDIEGALAAMERCRRRPWFEAWAAQSHPYAVVNQVRAEWARGQKRRREQGQKRRLIREDFSDQQWARMLESNRQAVLDGRMWTEGQFCWSE